MLTVRCRFFGSVSPENHPTFYISCIASLFQHYAKHLRPQGIPLLVNTHGWIKGLGLDLISTVFHLTRPSLIVQFRGGNSTNLIKTITGPGHPPQSWLPSSWRSQPSNCPISRHSWIPEVRFAAPSGILDVIRSFDRM